MPGGPHRDYPRCIIGDGCRGQFRRPIGTSNFDTVVLMKVSPNIVKTLADLEELGLTGQSTYVRRVSTDREKVIKDVTSIKDEDLDYFSLLIVKGNPTGSKE